MSPQIYRPVEPMGQIPTDGTIAMLKERSLVAANDLVTANSYKGKIGIVPSTGM